MTTANDTSSALERLGFIGLGNMGGAIALRLLRAGYPLTVLDLDNEKMNPLIEVGAGTAATPKEIAERSAGNLLDVPWIEPADVAAAVVYLASDRARFITGSQFVLDAGLLSR